MRSLVTIPENVIFDFGGVIADIDIHSFIQKLSELGADAISVKDIHPNNTGLFLLYEKGLVSTEEFLVGLRKLVPGAADFSDGKLVDLWNSIILPYDYSRFEIIEKLRSAGHKTFLLSNTNVLHHEYLETLFDKENPFGKKFRDFFNAVYYSDEMRMRKPDIEIFQRVLAEQNLDARDTIFIDDNAINLAAPAELGMMVYHFCPGDTLAGLFRI